MCTFLLQNGTLWDICLTHDRIGSGDWQDGSIGSHVIYPAGSPTTTTLGTCNSLHPGPQLPDLLAVLPPKGWDRVTVYILVPSSQTWLINQPWSNTLKGSSHLCSAIQNLFIDGACCKTWYSNHRAIFPLETYLLDTVWFCHIDKLRGLQAMRHPHKIPFYIYRYHD